MPTLPRRGSDPAGFLLVRCIRWKRSMKPVISRAFCRLLVIALSINPDGGMVTGWSRET
jgi:hypothetical protein